MDLNEQEQLLAQLTEAVSTQRRAVLDRDMLIRRGVDLGVSKMALARASKLTRRSIYDILEKS